MDDFKKGDVFWRRTSVFTNGRKKFMQIVELSGNGKWNQNYPEDGDLYPIKYLRHYSNNPHRVKKVYSEADLKHYWNQMSPDEAQLAKYLFPELDFADYYEEAAIRAGNFLKKSGII